MMEKLLNILVVSVLAGLVGCSSSSDTTTTATTASLSVTNISGGTNVMEGVWKNLCYSSAGAASVDWMDTFTFAGTKLALVTTAYTSTNLSCTGAASEAGTIAADVAIGVDEAIIAWNLNAGGAAAAPAALDGSGPISTTASFTKVDATYTAATGVFGAAGTYPVTIGASKDISTVVDDTGTVLRAYSINYTSGASTGVSDRYLTKQ